MELVIGRAQRAGVVRPDVASGDLLQLLGPMCTSPTLTEMLDSTSAVTPAARLVIQYRCGPAAVARAPVWTNSMERSNRNRLGAGCGSAEPLPGPSIGSRRIAARTSRLLPRREV